MRAILLCVLAMSFGASDAAAQSCIGRLTAEMSATQLCPVSAAPTQVRDRFAFSAGIIQARTSDHRFNQCGAGAGLSAGAEVRTRGAWLLAGNLDLLANLAVSCKSALYTTDYRGETVTVDVKPEIAGPRLAARAGRAFANSRFVLEPSVGVGYLRVSTDAGIFWSEWFGVVTAIRPANTRKALLFEVGWREIPIIYQPSAGPVIETAGREPMFRFVIEF